MWVFLIPQVSGFDTQFAIIYLLVFQWELHLLATNQQWNKDIWNYWVDKFRAALVGSWLVLPCVFLSGSTIRPCIQLVLTHILGVYLSRNVFSVFRLIETWFLPTSWWVHYLSSWVSNSTNIRKPKIRWFPGETNTNQYNNHHWTSVDSAVEHPTWCSTIPVAPWVSVRSPASTHDASTATMG